MASKVSQEAIQAGKYRQSCQGSVSLSEWCCCWAELCWPRDRQERAAEAGAGGLMPSSICQVCPVMAGSQGLPPGGAHFPSRLGLTQALLVKNSQLLLPPAFSPPVFICSPASGPRLALKPPEARKTGKGLQHLDLCTALL